MSIVWINEDSMSLDHPVLAAGGPQTTPVFIWDTQRHDDRAYSLKRRVFIYECALDLGVKIVPGQPYDVLRELAGEVSIYTGWTPDPDYRDIIADLRDTHEVHVVEAPGLAVVPDGTDTGRFFRFWNRIKTSAMTHSTAVSESDIA